MPALCVLARVCVCVRGVVGLKFGLFSALSAQFTWTNLTANCKVYKAVNTKTPRRHVRNNTLAVPPENSHVGRHFCKRVSLAEGVKTTCDVIGTFCSTRLTLWFKNRTVRKRKDNFSAGCQVQGDVEFQPWAKTLFDLLMSCWRTSDTEGTKTIDDNQRSSSCKRP